MFNIINLNIYHLRVIFFSLKNVRLLQITIKKTTYQWKVYLGSADQLKSI